MRYLLLLSLLFVAAAAAAQPSCVCTNGCKVAVWNPLWTLTGPDAPNSCSVYKPSVSTTVPIGTAPAVAGTALNNATICQPPDPVVTPAVVCIVSIPAQAAGPVTLTATATNAKGETGQSTTPYTFQSVSALATLPPLPVNIRPVP